MSEEAIACESCGLENRPGVLVCERCSAGLSYAPDVEESEETKSAPDSVRRRAVSCRLLLGGGLLLAAIPLLYAGPYLRKVAPSIGTAPIEAMLYPLLGILFLASAALFVCLGVVMVLWGMGASWKRKAELR